MKRYAFHIILAVNHRYSDIAICISVAQINCKFKVYTMKIPLEKFCDIPKIELHLHIDGAARWETLHELLKEKNLQLPGDGSFRDFKNACVVTPPGESLEKFLDRFKYYYSALVGDVRAIERIAYELCEDQAKGNVIYFEGRLSPQLLCTTDRVSAVEAQCTDDLEVVTPAMVVEHTLKGFKRGEKDFKVKAKLILCCVQGIPEWSEEVVNLCEKFKDQGVVGIDMVGKDGFNYLCEPGENFKVRKEDVMAFEKARKLGIHTTVHCCEEDPPECAVAAVNQLHIDRIGHGYQIVHKESVYQMILEKQIHLECCPQSSYCTGAVKMNVEHPIVRFAKDGMNFSLNSDDPTVNATRITADILLAKKLGLNDNDIVKCTYNAAKAAFLPESEKQELIQILDAAFIGKFQD
ncbi:Adenosine deaminase [Nymphon striatum]|nr:Adenosine deaminase [Nymphon striatum]